MPTPFIEALLSNTLRFCR